MKSLEMETKVQLLWKQRGRGGWVVRVSDCSTVPRDVQPGLWGVLEAKY